MTDQPLGAVDNTEDEILSVDTLVSRFREAAARLDQYAAPRATP